MHQSPKDSQPEEPAPHAVRRASGTITPLRPRRGATVEVPAPFGAERRDNLPAQLTSFVGRERETAEVIRLLEANRLVTLVGAPGVGKTRLALRVAEAVRDRFSDGVWLVELAPLADPRSALVPALVPQAVASALGVRETPGLPPRAALLGALGPRHVLLVLDNCEHLVQACAELAVELLRACPSVRILATSREILAIAGETTWTVPPLSLPDPDRPPPEHLAESEAARLFVARAAAARPGFVATAANAPAVAEICHRLDGIPLALELAAARVQVLSPEQIAARLDDRFRLLTAGSRTALPRQRTLRGAIDWSHDLLADEERALFRRLSVFAGGWTLEAAEAVCGDDDVLDLLSALVDKSLVLAEGRDGEMRYRLLETLRQYAEEELRGAGEEAALRGRHCAWFLELVERAELELVGPEQTAWLEQLEREHDNLRAAIGESIGLGDIDTGLRLAGALWRFWQIRGHLREGRDWLTRLLALPAATPHTAGRAKALSAAGFLVFLLGDYRTAEALNREGLAIRRAMDDRPGIVDSLHNLGLALRGRGDYAAARQVFEEGLEVNRPLGNPFWTARICNGLARVHFYEGDYAASRRLLEESLAEGEEAGDVWGRAISLGDLSDVARASGDMETARGLLEESLAIYQDLRDERGVAQCLEGFAFFAGAETQLERAVRLIGAAAEIRERIGEPSSPARKEQLDGILAAARRALAHQVYMAAWAEGRAISPDQAIDYALAMARPAPTVRMEPSAAAAPPLLSPREQEVAALVACGRTNRQIAEALVISERTAEWHVAKLLGKLDLETRAQLAVWAARHGLAPDNDA